MTEFGYSLEKIIESTIRLKEVRKSELQYGDLAFIHTKNSVYFIHVLGEDKYVVYGGWFDRKGLSPVKTSIIGCTWGGSVIKVDTVAACGLRIEFSNHVVTTPIKRVRLLRCNSRN